MAAPEAPLITVLGSLNIDLVSYVPHHPLPGETLTATSFAVSPGGKGANQAVACAKLSRSRDHVHQSETAHIRMVGAVGSDTYGSLLRSNLTAHGVDASGVLVREEVGSKTGIALIVVDEPTGQNRIILSPEANHSLLPEQFATLPGPKPDLLIMQLEIPLETVLQALRAAREAGVAVLLNPAPAVMLPDSAYEGLAHLVVNETEAATLGGVKEEELESEAGLVAVAKGFLAKGVHNVIVTLGGRGVFYMNNMGKQGLVPPEKAKVVDTTAAGDTFVGSYALEFVSAKAAFNIAGAVQRSNKAAAKTVEKLGAQDSIPWRDEL
ncbi:Ribokinase-like protein [Pseudomassariella vexata]|uniref:Ribokinase n=1 Tax=Pseudomassariella vexata TaxID=1141098 RepID=A0A1Y2DVF2_9PEZI|nr:Ribokinase-like protein [Pseudomassariella vexata]ORY63169.1 Ribokinase-like protein [Pseudomassariella vexata]